VFVAVNHLHPILNFLVRLVPILGEPLLDSTLRVDPHVYKISTITITNSLAYYDMQLLTAVTKFMVLAPGPNINSVI
jgi:hypothetical protein